MNSSSEGRQTRFSRGSFDFHPSTSAYSLRHRRKSRSRPRFAMAMNRHAFSSPNASIFHLRARTRAARRPAVYQSVPTARISDSRTRYRGEAARQADHRYTPPRKNKANRERKRKREGDCDQWRGDLRDFALVEGLIPPIPDNRIPRELVAISMVSLVLEIFQISGTSILRKTWRSFKILIVEIW